MEFLSLLYQLIFMPLQIIFEVIYYLAFRVIGNPGISIIALSFIVNLLVLPLYKRTDAIQEAERDMEIKLSKGVEHIKKTFKGDEQLMILQEYYRKNGYSPFDLLKGSLSLLLQIPFFVAAYQFISHLEILKGAALGPIRDLSMPDGLLTIEGVTFNVLPFIMTIVNIVSVYVFTKGLTRKSKIQLYSMACFFLMFLYTSPAGLVFYWTLNNVFNLLKNLIDSKKCFGFNNRKYNKQEVVFEAPNEKIFLFGSLFIAVLVGILIPSAVIGSSPREFVITDYFDNPLGYIAHSSALALGMSLLWGGVFYWLTPEKHKAKVEKIIWFFAGISVVNYMFFNSSFGVLSPTLQYENNVKFSSIQIIINSIVLAFVIYILQFIWVKYKRIVSDALIIAVVAFTGMALVNVFDIQYALDNLKNKPVLTKGVKEHIPLSKNGKNIIVIMLDRAIGEYVPYILKEKPELKDKFFGFTYYSNVVSFGGHTIFGAPSIFGGYEYTPLEINKRDKDSLVQKHYEASNLMPEIFKREGYSVVVGTPFTQDTLVTDENSANEMVVLNNRNFYFYGLFKTAPLILQRFWYDKGDYLSGRVLNQKIGSLVTAFGVNKNFIKEYKVLDTLPEVSVINDEGDNFITFVNKATHAPCLLQMPDYVPRSNVNNLEFFEEKIYTVDNKTLKIDSKNHISHYHANMAVLLKLAEWFDYMRINDVYNNTRIILVSDHGAPLHQIDSLMFNDGKNEPETLEWYFPLLLVKDFNGEGFFESKEFMTNADVVAIATNGVIDNPKNPFTGNVISNEKKNSGVQYIFGSHVHSLNKHNENTYIPGRWYSVHTNMWDRSNWKIAREKAALPY